MEGSFQIDVESAPNVALTVVSQLEAEEMGQSVDILFAFYKFCDHSIESKLKRVVNHGMLKGK